MNGLLTLLQMFVRSVTGYERRQQNKVVKARLRRELSTPAPDMDATGLELDLEQARTGSRPVVRRNCAFCGRERTPADDNHAGNCPYWSVGPGRDDL